VACEEEICRGQKLGVKVDAQGNATEWVEMGPREEWVDGRRRCEGSAARRGLSSARKSSALTGTALEQTERPCTRGGTASFHPPPFSPSGAGVAWLSAARLLLAMAKDKLPKPKGLPNKHLHTRTTFLYQAATYLTLQAAASDSKQPQSNETSSSVYSPLALQLGADLHTVSRKAQLRLAMDLKRSMCKGCHTVLVPGRTATQLIENQSKGGNKPWADVVVLSCNFCGGKKRFPVGAERQPKKSVRKAALESAAASEMEGVEMSASALQTGTEQSSSSG
jgi:ribonuclease P protein subunit RPR2